MSLTMFRYRVRRLWRKFTAPLRAQQTLPLVFDDPGCDHDVQPTENPDWGKCAKCGEADFPMTERAAWGAFECEACHDTGIVAVHDEAHPSAFADARCPACPRHGIRKDDE
jgi:hypothetical protein